MFDWDLEEAWVTEEDEVEEEDENGIDGCRNLEENWRSRPQEEASKSSAPFFLCPSCPTFNPGHLKAWIRSEQSTLRTPPRPFSSLHLHSILQSPAPPPLPPSSSLCCFRVSSMLSKCSVSYAKLWPPEISPAMIGGSRFRLASFLAGAAGRRSKGGSADCGPVTTRTTGMVFTSFEEVKKELAVVLTELDKSLARHKFANDYEATLNEKIKWLLFLVS